MILCMHKNFRLLGYRNCDNNYRICKERNLRNVIKHIVTFSSNGISIYFHIIKGKISFPVKSIFATEYGEIIICERRQNV